jgi:hypothetical protein
MIKENKFEIINTFLKLSHIFTLSIIKMRNISVYIEEELINKEERN